MRKSLDEQLIGKRFGRLIVISRGTKTNKSFVCKCDCGNMCEVLSDNLKKGDTKSCGCYHKEMLPYNRRTHGESKSRLYKTWKCMRARCNNKNNKSYKWYGGRGIKVCDEWDKSYEPFRNWAIENGYDPEKPSASCSLDRINNDGDYTPDNCRFVSTKVQHRNTSRNIFMTYNGKTQTVMDWAAETGINYGTLRNRVMSGWSTEDALKTPSGERRKIKEDKQNGK